MLDASLHPKAAFALDIADKAIKAIAVLLGGIWTYWNYGKSRTYEQKLQLQVSGDVFLRGSLYLDVAVVLENVGASKSLIQAQGTTCDVVAIMNDLSELPVRLFPVFALHTQIEPGESVSDHVFWRLENPSEQMVWLMVNLRVISGRIEWNAKAMVRVDPVKPKSGPQ